VTSTRKANGVAADCALEIARENFQTKVESVLGRLMTNPMQTRHEVRVKLGLLDILAAEIFAMTVFLCDGLLQLKPASHFFVGNFDTAAPTRFFAIASKLPMELQMILCHFAVESAKQNILLKVLSFH